MRKLDWLKRPIAHRGLHDKSKAVIENTSSAVQNAIAGGYAVEVDLQEASCGTPMVFHDYTLERLTTQNGRLRGYSAKDLKKISLKNSTDRMQSLDDLLGQVGGIVPLILEIKGDWGGTGRFEKAISGFVTSYSGPIAIMSFDPSSTRAIRHYAPDIARGLVAERFTDRYHWHNLSLYKRFVMRHLLTAFRCSAQFVAYDVNGLPAMAPYIARNLFNLPLLSWTVRTKEQADKASQYADAIIFEDILPQPSAGLS